MMRALLACVLFGLPFAAAAQGYSEAQKSAILAAFAGNACQINQSDAERILPQIGVSMIVFAAVMDEMEQAGQVTWSETTETLTLAPELCK